LKHEKSRFGNEAALFLHKKSKPGTGFALGSAVIGRRDRGEV